MDTDNKDLNYYNEDLDEAQAEERRQELMKKYEADLYQIVKKGGDVEKARTILKSRPELVNFDWGKKGWTPLVWASCKNHIDIVKLLLEFNAAKLYMQKEATDPKLAEFINPQKCVLGVINEKIKPTPLQHACFKGNIQIVWLLLKEGLSIYDVDQFGNNCILLAASGGNVQVFQTLLIWGANLSFKNSRGHDVFDLATDKEIINLINGYRKAATCAKSGLSLNGVTKHWCSTTKKFYHPDHYEQRWVWETPTSEKQEKLDGKCKESWAIIQQYSLELQACMKAYQHKELSEKIEEIQNGNIDIDLKLLHEAIELQEKLRTQNMILAYIDSLKVVENYRTLRKSVHQIQEMKEDAVRRGVKIDQQVTEIADGTIDRLNAERDLRYEVDMSKDSNCNLEGVKKLYELMENARKYGVAENYLDDAEVLKQKMEKSIKAMDIFKLFEEYPKRADYPETIDIDPKTKKPWFPKEKKFVDMKVYAAPKKKSKKKEPKFIIPDWATENGDLDSKIKQIEELLRQKDELVLDEDFIKKSQVEIDRMKKEFKFRKDLKKEEDIIAEWKAQQNKKKK